MAKVERTGLTRDDMDKMFDITPEKKKNMAEFSGLRAIKLPEIGDKVGITVRPLMSTDDAGNPAYVLKIKVDSPKMKTEDGTMLTMTVNEFETPEEKCSIPYPKSLDFSFVGETGRRGMKYEDLFGRWWRIVADEYDNPKAPSGKAKGYRAIYREDLNSVIPANKSSLGAAQI